MHLVFENGERFDTRDRLVRAVAEVLRRSPHCRVEPDRAERLAEEVLIAAARAASEGGRTRTARGVIPGAAGPA